MHIEELLSLFDTAAAGFPSLDSGSVREDLRLAIEGRKYDLQDVALIEAILRQDSRDLIESFREAYTAVLKRFENGSVNPAGDGPEKEAVRIYIASLEHLINYYHTSLIGKHFSST